MNLNLKYTQANLVKEIAANIRTKRYYEEKREYCAKKIAEHLGDAYTYRIVYSILVALPSDYKDAVDDKYTVLTIATKILSELTDEIIKKTKLREKIKKPPPYFVYDLGTILEHKRIVDRAILECELQSELQSSLQTNATKTKKLKL